MLPALCLAPLSQELLLEANSVARNIGNKCPWKTLQGSSISSLFLRFLARKGSGASSCQYRASGLKFEPFSAHQGLLGLFLPQGQQSGVNLSKILGGVKIPRQCLWGGQAFLGRLASLWNALELCS